VHSHHTINIISLQTFQKFLSDGQFLVFLKNLKIDLIQKMTAGRLQVYFCLFAMVYHPISADNKEESPPAESPPAA